MSHQSFSSRPVDDRRALLPSLADEALALLRAHPAGLSEHALLKALAGHAAFAGLAGREPLALFRRHFLLMHTLYSLQATLWSQRQVLELSPLCIRLSATVAPGLCQPAQDDSSALRDFYLDWSHYHHTEAADVAALLADFWRRAGRSDERSAALRSLQLPEDADADAITRRYRQLAARHHPDRGGDSEAFIRARQAYECLLG